MANRRMEEKSISNFVYIYFETQNLLVRQYTINDIDGLLQIMSNPQVHQYTKDKNHPWDRLKTEQYIQFFMDKKFVTLDCFHGAIIEKASYKIIGLAGLNPYKENEPEIEWKLGVKYWNKGYATEIGKEIISEAFKRTNILGIYGMVEPENTASRRVLQKIGMKYLGINQFRDQKDAFYYIERF
jgi:Acetyltransferases, including N-acetylases of ribosomal proteins